MTFRASVEKVYRETRGINPLAFIPCLLVQLFMQSLKTHSKALFILKILQYCKQDIAKFYLAEILYFYGDFPRALEYLNSFLPTNPNHADAIYLKSILLALLGQKQESFSLLENLLLISSRLKTWIILAKITEDSQDFEIIERLYHKNINNFQKFTINESEILKHLANAAAKVGKTKEAKIFLQKALFLLSPTKPKKLLSKVAMNPKNAKLALNDLRNLLESNNIAMFLISGTFLGCVREGNFIAHDNDIDIGIWQKDISKLKQLILANKSFVIRDSIPNLIQILHLNGIPIDVFAHYQEGDSIYHDGHFQRWRNSLFNLIEYDFLGSKYLAPQNCDLYLTENYGKDYMTPKNSSQYNYVLSTPNIEILDKQRYVIFLYNLLFDNFSAKNETKILEELKRLGEEVFVEKFLDFKQGKAQ